MVRQIDISDEVGAMFVLHESYGLKKERCFALNSWIENDVWCTVEISCLRSGVDMCGLYTRASSSFEM